MRWGILTWILTAAIVVTLSSSSEAARRRHQKAPIYQPKYSAIVIDADTGKVLEADDPDGQRHPASLTKMMTLYLVFDELRRGRLRLSTRMPVSSYASHQAPSKLGLRPGQTITVDDGIRALATKSANDVAVIFAEYLAGSEEAFARRMTQKAQALGMSHTNFKNASGLPHPLQITTARDMATLSRALYRNFPKHYSYFKQRQFIHKGVVHRNHNHLLGKVPGVDGIKTGFIAASGFNLAASAVRYDDNNKPHRLIAVVLGGANRHWRDRRVSDLLEANFQRIGINQGQQRLIPARYAVPEESSKQVKTEEVIRPSEIDVEQLLENLAHDNKVLSEQNATVRATPVGWVQAKPEVKITKTKITKKSIVQEGKAVQVGAYHRQDTAQKAAAEFQRLAGEGVMKIMSGKKGKKQLHTVVFQKISPKAIEKACQKWRAQGNDCLVK
jgi:D-alanyl-D-alanine carboxypeptidase